MKLKALLEDKSDLRFLQSSEREKKNKAAQLAVDKSAKHAPDTFENLFLAIINRVLNEHKNVPLYVRFANSSISLIKSAEKTKIEKIANPYPDITLTDKSNHEYFLSLKGYKPRSQATSSYQEIKNAIGEQAKKFIDDVFGLLILKDAPVLQSGHGYYRKIFTDSSSLYSLFTNSVGRGKVTHIVTNNKSQAGKTIDLKHDISLSNDGKNVTLFFMSLNLDEVGNYIENKEFCMIYRAKQDLGVNNIKSSEALLNTALGVTEILEEQKITKSYFIKI